MFSLAIFTAVADTAAATTAITSIVTSSGALPALLPILKSVANPLSPPLPPVHDCRLLPGLPWPLSIVIQHHCNPETKNEIKRVKNQGKVRVDCQKYCQSIC